MSAQSSIYNPSIRTSAATGDGFSVPRNTTAGRLATVFTTADDGMMVFDTDLNNLFIWNGSAWESIPSSGDSLNTEVIFNDAGVLVGDPGLVYDKTLQRLTVATNLRIHRGFLNDSTSVAVGPSTLTETIAGAIRNTFVGSNAGQFVSSGNRNVGVGSGAIQSVNGFELTGSQNVGVGNNALAAANLGANNNTAIGNAAGGTVTTGAGNVAVGHDALNGAGITGNNNIAVGNTAMSSASTVTGADNIGIGRDTFRNLTSASSSIAIGFEALKSLTSGGSNVAIGNRALGSVVTGANNTAVGFEVMPAATSNNNTSVGNSSSRFLTIGSENTAFGAGSMYTNVSGQRNVCIGYNANVFGTGSYNTIIGAEAGSNATHSGSFNIFIGDGTGGVTTSGQSNICIGIAAQTTGATASNQISIGNATYYVGTDGAANTYFTTATALSTGVLPATCGFWRVIINGTARKIPVYAD